MRKPDRVVLTVPHPKVRAPLPPGFKDYVNDTPSDMHPWTACALGHRHILQATPIHTPVVILEDDVVPQENFEDALRLCDLRKPPQYVVNLCAVLDLGLPVRDELIEYPPRYQEWGTQALYYPPESIDLAIMIIDTWLELVNPENGFDCYFYKALRALNVPVYFHAATQHGRRPSSCLSSPFSSPFFPEVDLCSTSDTSREPRDSRRTNQPAECGSPDRRTPFAPGS